MLWKLLFEKLIPKHQHREQNGTHVRRSNRDGIARLEPANEFAILNFRGCDAMVVNYGNAKMPKIAPEIMTSASSELFLHNPTI